VIARAVVVPHPPLLVPELVTGAVRETEQVRRSCLDAAARLAEVAPVWVAVATDPSGPRFIEPEAVGTFRGYGVDLSVRLARARNARRPDPLLPLPALMAGWLGEQVDVLRVGVELVSPNLPARDCWLLGAHIASCVAGEEPVGLLVLGDGSARHTDRGPGGFDARASAFDTQVRDALAAADARELLRLDAGLAEQLGAAGRAAWQVLAGVALSVDGPQPGWHGELLYSGAPYGVGYHVAVWDAPFQQADGSTDVG
jgi:hypothetical protein